MIDNLLLHYQTKSTFESDLGNDLISDTSIVFIKETKEIWTHGVFYDASSIIETDEEIIAFAFNKLNEQIQSLNNKLDNLDILPKNVIFDDNDIYIQKTDGHIYPVNHPDLSTQPSIIPQRFGTQKIYEVLVRNLENTDQVVTNEIPQNALILEASAFNSNSCVPASTRKEDKKIVIENDMGIIPDFILVRYTLSGVNYYTYY